MSTTSEARHALHIDNSLDAVLQAYAVGGSNPVIRFANDADRARRNPRVQAGPAECRGDHSKSPDRDVSAATQAALVAKTEERLEQARMECKQAEIQQKSVAGEVEKAESRKRNAQDPTAQQREEQTILVLRSSVEIWTAQAQQCQADQTDADIQFRNEQAKMNELQSLLDRLDQVLAGDARE